MKNIIDKMREDFIAVAEWRREAGEWTEEDEKEIGAAIAEVIKRDDREMIACWARWLADLSAWCAAYNLIIKASERRMKEAAKAERDRKAAEGVK